jgi:hypothetical protein
MRRVAKIAILQHLSAWFPVSPTVVQPGAPKGNKKLTNNLSSSRVGAKIGFIQQNMRHPELIPWHLNLIP